VDALRAIKASGLIAAALHPLHSIFRRRRRLTPARELFRPLHRPELDKAAGVVIYDSGTGKTTGFSPAAERTCSDTAKSIIAPSCDVSGSRN